MGDGPDVGDDAAFAKRLGAQLRSVRLQQRLSLNQLAARSGGSIRASLLGAWERGERRVSVERLAQLAELYGVAVDRLLPDAGGGGGGGGAGAGAGGSGEDAKIRVDLDALRRHDDPTSVVVLRFAESILRRRRDLNGHVATIRRSDLDALSATTGTPIAELLQELMERGIVHAV